jgi:hypothetical protein
MTTPVHQTLPPPKQIRFVNNQGQPPSKRRRINAAYVKLPRQALSFCFSFLVRLLALPPFHIPPYCMSHPGVLEISRCCVLIT